MQSITHLLKPASLLCVGMLAAAVFASPSRSADSFDGKWTVSIAVKTGACMSRTVPIRVSNGRVSYAGPFEARATGKISPTGSLDVSFSRKGDVAHAAGAVAGTSGRGHWTSPTVDCSGTWSARRA